MSQYLLMSVYRMFVCHIHLNLNCCCMNRFTLQSLQLNQIIQSILAFAESQRKCTSSNWGGGGLDIMFYQLMDV